MRFRPDDALAFLLVSLTAVLVVLMVIQSSWLEALVASGFLLVTLGWFGMHLRLRREAPDHPLARASYVSGPKRGQRRNVLALISAHWDRHRVDSWTALLSAGLLIILGAFVWGAVR